PFGSHLPGLAARLLLVRRLHRRVPVAVGVADQFHLPRLTAHRAVLHVRLPAPPLILHGEPRSIPRLRIGLSPKLELAEVFDRDLAIAQAIKQMVAKRPREIRPLDLGHYSPNVICASSSLRRFCSAAFDEFANRSASSKNARFSRS